MDVDRVKGKDKGKGYHNKSNNSKGDKGKSNGKCGKGYGFQQNQGKGGWSSYIQGWVRAYKSVVVQGRVVQCFDLSEQDEDEVIDCEISSYVVHDMTSTDTYPGDLEWMVRGVSQTCEAPGDWECDPNYCEIVLDSCADVSVMPAKWLDQGMVVLLTAESERRAGHGVPGHDGHSGQIQGHTDPSDLATTLLEQVKTKASIELSTSDDLLAGWAYTHAGHLHNCFSVTGGTTPHERAFGVKYQGKLAMFAECVYFALATPHVKKGKPRFVRGLFLGKDECFLAYSVPYSYTDLLADLARWPVETEALALTAAGKEVLALRLGNQSAQHRACIVARAHPGETHASWVMRGVMEFLMGDPEAQSCLDQLAWLLVPMLNPDGVMAGRTRTNLDAVDLNRHHHDDSAPETKGLKNALQAEAREGELLAFIDIHSHSRRRGIFAIANASDGDRLVSLMASRTHLLDAAGTSRSEIRAQDAGVGRVAAASQGYKYSLTIESSLCARHVEVGGEHLLLQDLASVGRSICLAVADLLSSTDETTNQTPPETAKVPNSMFAEGVVDAEDHDEADEEAVLEERRPDSS
eukprot:s4713_g3.t1